MRHEESRSLSGWCHACSERWPCDVISLGTELQAARTRADQAEAALAELRAAAIEDIEWDDGTFMQSCLSCRLCGWSDRDADDPKQWHHPSCLLAQPAPERGRAIVEALAELIDSLDAVGEFQSGPTQAQYDRQVAALDRVRALAPTPGGPAVADGRGPE